jgi:hypothetical protein
VGASRWTEQQRDLAWGPAKLGWRQREELLVRHQGLLSPERPLARSQEHLRAVVATSAAHQVLAGPACQ